MFFELDIQFLKISHLELAFDVTLVLLELGISNSFNSVILSLNNLPFIQSFLFQS